MSAPAFEIPGYELIRELGAGGMATVFLAVQRSLDRKVAIKVMRRGSGDDNAEKRFLLEGRTMARLPHPNIVGVYDIVQNDAINYIAMEFLEGGMLSERMRQGLTLAEAISVVVQVAGALQFAHDSGIVHRDLKPSNIMYRDAATPVLTDFGIAKQQNGESTRLTQTGMMIGTPTYMSPEQATGSELDGRSDQYALGVLFYEMLTGHAPFEGSTPIQVVLAHLNSPPPPLPPQFAFFQPLMDRMLAKDREQRYPDLKIFVKELKQLLTGSDALLQKLRIDPSSTASEQLRALGFSESQIHTGAGAAPRVSAQRPMPSSRGPVTGSGPGVRMGGGEPARGRPGWLLPAAIAGVLAVAGVGGWLAFRGGGQDLDPAVANILNRELAAVDQLIGAGKLVSPPGDNAFERLQEAMQLALTNVDRFPEGEKRQLQIVTLLRERASKAMAAKQFAEAESRVGEALAVKPDDADTLKLQQSIVTAKLAVEREVKVAELLGRASQAAKAGRKLGEGSDNALAAIRDALAIDPESAAAKQALQALIAELLQPAQRALDAGRLDEADTALQQSAAYLAGEPGWRILSDKLGQARSVQQQQRKIDGLLTLAKRQLAVGRIAEPAGDNVLETLQRVVEIDAGNSAAMQLRKDATAKLVAQAKAAEQQGKFAEALTRYDQVLQANPGDAASAQARTALQNKVGAQQVQILGGLSSARDAIASRNFFAPAGKNAYEALQGVLKLDAANAQARQLLADLPKLSREAATALAGEGRLDAAIALLKDAQAIYKNDADIALLASQLGNQKASADKAAQRGQYVQEVQALLASRQLNAESARKIGFAIKQLQQIDAQDADAARFRQQFLRGLGAAIEASARPEQLAAWVPVLDQVKQQLGAGSADVVALLGQYSARQSAVEAAERERIAAMSGVLVLNAAPWASIESVVEQSSGKAIALPQERSTPLRLSVPEGTYRVSFKHPDVSRAVVQVASVKAKSTQTTQVSFPTLTATDYLQRAGYAN